MRTARPAARSAPWFLVLLLVGVPLAFVGCYGFFLLSERPFIRRRPADLTAAVVAAWRSRPVPRVDVPSQRG